MRRLLVGLVLLAAVLPVRADEASDIIERAVTAHGGAANLERWTATRMTFESHQSALPDMRYSGTWLVASPDRQKIDMRLEQPGIEQPLEVGFVLSGGKGWLSMKLPGQGEGRTVTDLDPTMMRDVNVVVHQTRVCSLLPLLRDRQFTLTALPETTVAERRAVGVRASFPERPDVSLYFDKETGLLVKTSYRHQQGQPADKNPEKQLHETLFTDYREMGAQEERLLDKAGVKADGPSLRAYLAKLRPDPVAVEKARALVKLLGDESFAVREKTAEELVALGAPAIPALQTATRDEDLEVARRAALCLEKITMRGNRDTTRAAVRLLVLRAPDGAAETLLALLPGAEDGLVEDIRSALVPLAQQPGGPDAALLRALDDKDPARRDAARAVLGKDEGAWLNRPGRRLLLPGVRVSIRQTYLDDSQKMEITVTDLFNRLDDKEFARP